MKLTAAKIAGAIVIVGCIAMATGLWFVNASVTTEFDGTRSIKIRRGSTFPQVVQLLQEADILAADRRFSLAASITGWHRQIKPGHYAIESGMSNLALLNRLRKGLQTPVRVTIPPGSRPGVVAAVLRRDLDIDSTAFRAALRDASLLASLSTDTVNVFGYMMPETLEFFWGTSSAQVVSRLKNAYTSWFNEERQAKAEKLNLTFEDVLTVASIVEWEARLDEERAIIAGVYLNRLRIRMPLQADPTVQFALMQLEGGRMRRLIYDDYRLDHPYNTYKYYGLPPGPINNPSTTSVDAVLNADQHKYLYFVADGSGGHTFSRTLREHNNAANKYRRLMRQRRREQAG